jgi:threonine dehydratase
MPIGAPLPKVAATKAYGATVRLEGATIDDSLLAAQEFADQTGAVFIHPFDHRDVIAGQGTVGLEILEQCPDVRTIVTAVGGGGLISGIAVAAKAANPEIRIIGVQAEGAAAVPVSLREGSPQRVPGSTIADGIAVGRPGDVTFAHMSALVDDVVTVADEEITRSMVMLLERGKLVVEAAGAVGVAALLSGAVTDLPTPVVVVLSGGNIDPLLTVRVIERGLVAAGRYLRFTVRCPDRPGQLAALLTLIGQQGANVDDVVHRRHDARLRLGEVEVDLSVETRGAEHSDILISTLREAGYEVTFSAR